MHRVEAIRRRCKKARIIVRGDSAFAREAIMAWCEAQPRVVYYALGLGTNARLTGMIQDAPATARARRGLTGAASARAFQDLEYQTRTGWSRARRVVAKAEVTAAGDNPRFVVTNLPAQGFRGEDRERFCAARLYEEFYCGRGEMENVLKQQVLDLRADRLSTHALAGNQLRLGLTTLAYLLLERLRASGARWISCAVRSFPWRNSRGDSSSDAQFCQPASYHAENTTESIRDVPLRDDTAWQPATIAAFEASQASLVRLVLPDENQRLASKRCSP